MGPEAGTTQIVYDVFNGRVTYLVLYQHRPSTSDESSVFDDLMLRCFRFSAWSSYHSEKWGYTIDYPATWYDLGKLGGPDTETYFANEKNVGSPIGMDSQGAFFAHGTWANTSPGAPPDNVDATAPSAHDAPRGPRIIALLQREHPQACAASRARTRPA